MGSKAPRLRDRINTALQKVPKDKCPKASFLDVWQNFKADYEVMRGVIHENLSGILDKEGVRATVASRTKTLDSISKSIDRRDDAKPQEQKYRSPRDIFRDLHDLVGVRVVVDYPSGLKRSYDLIEHTFQVERFNSFSSERDIGQHWKTKFGAYETRNYLVRLGSSADAASYAGVLFEIQVTTMAESLYNKLAHPLLYKTSNGTLSRRDEMIIDMGHGAALLYWITVACMEERLEGSHEGSRFPQSVRHLAGHEGTTLNLDAVVRATPDIPSTSKDSTSRHFLLKSLADIGVPGTSEEEVWTNIREKLGLDHNRLLSSLPIVPEARFDSKDLEDSPKCHEKTRHEIRNIIKQWVDDSEAEIFFWLHAPAGVGKSTLARTLVHDLRRLQLAAGYFFKRGHELRNDTSRLFPTVASQLTRTIPSFASALRLSIGTMNLESMEKISLREQFKILIYNPLSSIKHIPRSMLIIIDALDECTTPNNLQLVLQLFAQLRDLETFRICVFFSSRHTRSLTNSFEPFLANATCRDMALHEEFLATTRLEMREVLEDGLREIKRQRNVRKDPWPRVKDFNLILRHATTPSPLFIYTSTFLRHINSRDPNKRLKRWIERSRQSDSQLDHIYDPILKSILAGDGVDDVQEPLDLDEILSLQLILGSIVLMARPVSAKALQSLLAIDEDIFNTTLEALHAVVSAPDDHSPLSLVHKSFADYVLGIEDETVGYFRITPSQIHDRLAKSCIDRMMRGLRKNICKVRDPLLSADQFKPDIVAKFIPEDLVYACTHWIYHIERGEETFHLARPFLEKHLLHWLEALSILGEHSLGHGGLAIRTLLTLTEKFPVGGSLLGSDIIKEAQLFLESNSRMMKEHPLQVYGGCLVREAPNSKVRQLFAESPATRLASIGRIRGGRSLSTSFVNSINVPTKHCVAISSDGRKVAGCGEGCIEIADSQTGLSLDTLPGGAALGRELVPWERYRPTILAICFSYDQLNIVGLTPDAKVFEWDTRLKSEGPLCRGSFKAVSEPFESGEINDMFSMAVATRGTMVYAWNFQHGFGSSTESSALVEEAQVVDGKVNNRMFDVSLSVQGSRDWTIAMINIRGNVFVWSGSAEANGENSALGNKRGRPSRNDPIASQTLIDANSISQPRSDVSRLSQPSSTSYQYPRYSEIPNPSKVISMLLSSNKRTLVTKSATHTVLIWDVETGLLKHKIHGGGDTRAISSDGSMLAIETPHGCVDLWNLETSPAARNQLSTGPYDLECIEFISDSKSLAIADFLSLSRWNVETAGRQWIYKDDTLFGTVLKLTPDESTIIVTSASKAYLIDAMTGSCQIKLDLRTSCPQEVAFMNPSGPAILDISFSYTGRIALFHFDRRWSKKHVLVWDLDSPKTIAEDQAVRYESSYIGCITKSGPKEIITYKGYDTIRIRLWEVYATAGNRLVLAENDGQFTVVEFDDDRISEI
ncbi:vegetative incompatibility protein het-e-1 [Fusarium flagelliforme]|uniref:Vegetative incompatibility protein het-e-1 n=1 Tax=Fusarium flagelliforme TaxID=2675880 RepID=A0A395MEQ0_9HYPO|nr:vegetative incompatibility protein het-e-1 [Fusarium flagelliforme]